jgi:hypothetical protein
VHDIFSHCVRTTTKLPSRESVVGNTVALLNESLSRVGQLFGVHVGPSLPAIIPTSSDSFAENNYDDWEGIEDNNYSDPLMEGYSFASPSNNQSSVAEELDRSINLRDSSFDNVVESMRSKSQGEEIDETFDAAAAAGETSETIDNDEHEDESSPIIDLITEYAFVLNDNGLKASRGRSKRKLKVST